MTLTGEKREFVVRVITAAKAYCKRLGLGDLAADAVVLVTACQAILESGFGTSENAKNALNFFGHKANIRISKDEFDDCVWQVGTYRLSRNPEEVDGVWVYDDKTDFWKFPSLESSVLAHIDYITGRSGMTRYANPPADPDAMAQWLTTAPRAYATDSKYTEKLRNIRQNYGLDELVKPVAVWAEEEKPEPAPAPAPIKQENPIVAEMPITLAAYAGKVYSGTQVPNLIVIHDVECPCEPGRAMSVAKYFSGKYGSAPGGVAHYTVDPESTVHSVPENKGCAHCGTFGNKNSVGIEMCGYATDNWLDEAHVKTWKRAADLARQIGARHGIPMKYLSAADLKAGKRGGWTYHMDVAKGLGGTTHMDPGPKFPHEQFKAYIERATDAAPAPTQGGTAPAPVPPKPSTSTAVKALPLLKPGMSGGEAGLKLKIWLQKNYPAYAKNVGIGDDWIGVVGSDSWNAMQKFARNKGLLKARDTLDAWGPRCWAAAASEGFKA